MKTKMNQKQNLSLNKFNDLFNKIIFEQVQSNEETEDLMQSINDYDAFFRAYIEPLAEKLQIAAMKARYNVFRVYGQLENIINFFKSFKIDKRYLNNQKEKFQLLNPLICFGEYEHIFNKGKALLTGRIGSEGETLDTQIDNQPLTINKFNNQIDKNIFGRWIDLINFNEVKADQTQEEQVKFDTPQNISKRINKFIKDNKLSIDNDMNIYVEFMVNVDQLPNNSYEELSKAIPLDNLSDRINNRPEVVNPQPNQGVLGTIDTSKVQNITKEANKSVKKSVKVKTVKK